MQQNGLYYDYFKHQVINHPDLNYDANSNDMFGIINWEESIGALRSSVIQEGYLFRLIMYTYRISRADNRSEVLKYPTGGFIIAKGHSNRIDGAGGMLQALDDAEKITDHFLEKMIADSENNHPLFYNSFNFDQQINVQPILHSGGAGYSGWRTIFNFSNYFRNCPTHADAPAWADGGETPY